MGTSESSWENRNHSRYFNRGDLIEEIGSTGDGRIGSLTAALNITKNVSAIFIKPAKDKDKY